MTSSGTLYEKVLDLHTVRRLPSGRRQLFIGLHLLNEVSSPQAFGMLRERGIGVLCPERTFATVDHVIPTTALRRPWPDADAEAMQIELEANVGRDGIRYFAPGSGRQGIVHVVGPELGLTQPGTTICCGDSHTSTLGAFGNISFGIGASHVRDVLAAQSLPLADLKVRRIDVRGRLAPGVFAKDVILAIIRRLGAKGGVGWAYEYGGSVVDALSMEERMTICNMSIEGGALCGYVNPDATTTAYLEGRPYAPRGAAWERAVAYWHSVASSPAARYDDRLELDADALEPMVTWGVTPAQCVGVNEPVPELDALPQSERVLAHDAYDYMGVEPGRPLLGMPVDVAFVGSCSNSRISDFEAVAAVIRGTQRRVPKGTRALIVPGSEAIHQELVTRGLAALFVEAGFEVRRPGCSLCIGMNADALEGRQVGASTSTRNFKGRQGSVLGRTLLMSPAMVAAAALTGQVVDARELLTREAEA